MRRADTTDHFRNAHFRSILVTGCLTKQFTAGKWSGEGDLQFGAFGTAEISPELLARLFLTIGDPRTAPQSLGLSAGFKMLVRAVQLCKRSGQRATSGD